MIVFYYRVPKWIGFAISSSWHSICTKPCYESVKPPPFSSSFLRPHDMENSPFLFASSLPTSAHVSVVLKPGDDQTSISPTRTYGTTF